MQLSPSRCYWNKKRWACTNCSRLTRIKIIDRAQFSNEIPIQPFRYRRTKQRKTKTIDTRNVLEWKELIISPHRIETHVRSIPARSKLFRGNRDERFDKTMHAADRCCKTGLLARISTVISSHDLSGALWRNNSRSSTRSTEIMILHKIRKLEWTI